MRNPYKGWTSQQILDHYPHPIPQPDSEEARQARVGQRFRMYFLLDADKAVVSLSKKPASAERSGKAKMAVAEMERAQALMLEPQNAFLAKDHARHVTWLLAELQKLIG